MGLTNKQKIDSFIALGWSEAMAKLILRLFTKHQPRQFPFTLRGKKIHNPVAFYKQLGQEILQGYISDWAISGDLEQDLKALLCNGDTK